MKKLKPLWIICLTAALLLLFAVGVSAYTLGDVDFDGSVTASDARLALRAAVGLEDIPFDTEAFYAADVDDDYVITASDARLILRAAVGLEDLGYTVPTEDPRGFIVDMTRDFGIVLDGWYWDNNEPDHIWVNLYLDNYTDDYIDFTFFDWGVNRCLTPDYYCENVEDTLVPPHSATVVTYMIYDGGVPTDFSIAPAGSIAFQYNVIAYEGEPFYSESHPLRENIWEVIWDDSLTAYDSYDPYVSRGWDEWTDISAFTFFTEKYDSIDRSNDTLHVYFLYRNLTGEAQIVEMNLLAINDIPVSEYNSFVAFQTVYEHYTAVIDMFLYYGNGEYPGNLGEVGVWPSDVYKVDYELIIRDEYSYEILYYNTWTFTR